MDFFPLALPNRAIEAQISFVIKSVKIIECTGQNAKCRGLEIQFSNVQKPKKWVVYILYTAVYTHYTEIYRSKTQKYRDEEKYRRLKARNT